LQFTVKKPTELLLMRFPSNTFNKNFDSYDV
jgi:hypothetical protein